jgi:methylenetetrahydrofolate reductase (NADPH)
MRITDFLDPRHPFPSLEIIPPQSGIVKEELLDNIAPLMEFKPRYINVTTHRDEVRFTPKGDGAFLREVIRSRVSPVAVCGSIQSRYDVEVVPHIICAGNTAAEIEWLVQDFHFLGIDNVMALRGDSLAGEKRFNPVPGGYAHADELVRAIRQMDGGEKLCIGVGGYPEKHFEAANPETDILHLKGRSMRGRTASSPRCSSTTRSSTDSWTVAAPPASPCPSFRASNPSPRPARWNSCRSPSPSTSPSN